MRLIDADALHEFVEKEFRNDTPYEWAWALTVVDHAPTIDAVYVVRCEDCKHNDMNGGDCNRTMVMCRRDHVLELNVYEYIKLEHCSYGERKKA